MGQVSRSRLIWEFVRDLCDHDASSMEEQALDVTPVDGRVDRRDASERRSGR